jgi:hypothetical protein
MVSTRIYPPERNINISTILMQVAMLKYLILLTALMVLVAGCTLPVGTQEQKPADEKNQTCTTVSQLVPSTEEKCSNITYTEPVCQRRKLNYTTNALDQIDLCSSDGACTGKPINECYTCTKALTRCQLVIKNLDGKRQGTWTAGANFTLKSGGFVKDPVTISIGPNESEIFDFQQIYVPDSLRYPAICKVYVLDVPTVEDCHEETRTRRVCSNVTEYKSVDKKVCN